MSSQLYYLECCVRDACIDDQAVDLLRAIIRGAAERAPVEALVEIGQTLIDIRKRDQKASLENN